MTPPNSGPKHEILPNPNDPMFKPGTTFGNIAAEAKRDLTGLTDEELDKAFEGATEGFGPDDRDTPKRRIAEQALDAVGIGQAAAETAPSDLRRGRTAIAEEEATMREIEDSFRHRHGIELGDETKNPFGKRMKLWFLRRSNSPIDADALRRHDAAKGARKAHEREIRYHELAIKDTTTRGALTQLSKSLREMEQTFYKAHGMAVMRDASAAELHKRFNAIAKQDPHALGMLRTYLEAREQLARLEKAAGIDKE